MTERPTLVERVATDASLRAVLVAARSCGVAPSVFLGAPVRTEYEYHRGVLVASTTPGWSDQDRDLILALGEFEADTCPGCGGYLKETTDPENEEMYVAGQQALCHRCVAFDQYNNSERAKNLPHPGARLLGATLKTRETQNADPLPT